MSDDLAHQDEVREELIGGKVFLMSPGSAWNHNCVCSNISRLFGNYLHGKQCTPIADGMDLYLDEENRLVPDFMVVCDPDKIRWNGVHGAPDLAVEVLSPSTTRNDKTIKAEVYARCGVKEYWLVNPIDKSVEIYLPEDGKFVLREVYTLYPDWELERMSERERSELIMKFRCSLFDDLEISLEDIFYRTF